MADKYIYSNAGLLKEREGTVVSTGVPQAGDIVALDANGLIDPSLLPPIGSGTVTSVGLTVPTGLSVAGSPVTTSGVLAVTYAAGYSIPTNIKQGQWDTAYTNRIDSLTTVGTSGAATLIANVLNIPNYATGSGTVETIDVATANGFAGTSDGDPADPVLTLSTTVTGMLKGNGTAISAAVANTDYQSPISLTTLGTSGAATFIANTLNIPDYTTTPFLLTDGNATTANGSAVDLGGLMLQDTFIDGDNTHNVYINDIGYINFTTALDNFDSPNPDVKANFEFASRDVKFGCYPNAESAGSYLWLDYNSSGRNIFELRSWYDPGLDETKIEGRATLGGSHDGYLQFVQSAGTFYWNGLTNLSTQDKLLGIYQGGSDLLGKKMGYISLAGGLSLSGGVLTGASGTVGGTGTTNELAYWTSGTNIGALAVATYPSLTEISYVKGVTSAIQTQLNGKANTALSNLASVAINTSLISDADNTDDLGSAANGWKDVYLRTIKMDGSASGTITFQGQAAAGTYNFNLPTTAGTSGYLLTSAGGVGSPMTWTNPATIPGTFALTNGNGTTANGTAVDLGGLITGPTSIDLDTHPIFFIGSISGGDVLFNIDGSSGDWSIGDSPNGLCSIYGSYGVNSITLNADKFNINDTSLGTASNGYVWTLANNGTGEGGWQANATQFLTQYRLAIGDASNLLSDAAAITGDRALISDTNGVPTHSTATATEVGFLSGVSSSIQTQLNTKISALAAIGSSPNANGASISGSTLTLQPASASFGGVVTTTSQVFAGDKGFNGGFYGGTINTNIYVPSNNSHAEGGANTLRLHTVNTDIRVGIGRGSGGSQIPAGYNYAGTIIAQSGASSNTTGTHDIIANLAVKAPAITNNGATITNSASLYVEGASGVASNNFALLVKAGTSALEGAVKLGTSSTTGYVWTATDTLGNGDWAAASGGGYTNLTQFVAQTAWRNFYSDGSGDVQEQAFGASGTAWVSNGTTAAPTWQAVQLALPTFTNNYVLTGDGTNVPSTNIGLQWDETTNMLALIEGNYKCTVGFGASTSVYSSIGSLGGGAGFYMGTGVKTSATSNALDKTNALANTAHFFYTRYDRGLEFHTGVIGNPGDVIADTTNLRWYIPDAGHFIPGSDATFDIGTSALGINDIHFGSGGLISFGAGNAVITHSSGLLTSNVDIVVPDEAYDATTWNGSLEVPTKNAIRDKIESMSAGSGITRTVVVTSGSATMGSTASTDYIYKVAGAHTMTLPTAVGNLNTYTLKNTHSANITIDTTSSQTIDGTLTISLAPNNSVTLFSDNSNWFII